MILPTTRRSDENSPIIFSDPRLGTEAQYDTIGLGGKSLYRIAPQIRYYSNDFTRLYASSNPALGTEQTIGLSELPVIAVRFPGCR
jgi:hypothetical protein